MIAALRKAFGLMEPSARARLFMLLPLMAVASSTDFVTVWVASGLLDVLTNPNGAWLSAWASSMGVPAEQHLPFLAASMFAVVAASNVATILTTHMVNRFGFGQSSHLSLRVLDAIIARPYAWFLHQNTARLKQQTLVETRRIAGIIIVGSAQTAARAAGGLLIIGWLLYRDPLFGLMLGAVVAGFYISYLWIVQRRMRRLGATRSAEDKLRHQIVEESLIGVKELKLLGLESEAIERLRVPSERFAESFAMTATMMSTAKPAIEVAAIAGLCSAMLFFWVTEQPLNVLVALLGTYAVGAYRLLPTAQVIVRTAMGVQAESKSLEEVYAQVHDSPPKPADPEMLSFERELRVEDLSYQYPEADDVVIPGLTWSLKRGEWVALVGPTGSGKTTLVDLLMGLLAPDEGTVKVDGEVLDTAERVRGWQSRIGYVPQTLFMSDTTIARNIAFGDAEPDTERVRRSAEMAQIANFVESELSEGYDTRIGERGVRVSGGQRQRIGIARALYRRPDLLILDEATSALDNTTEAAVMAALREEFADTTVVMIAHRLATTRYCDRIVMLERGRVLAEGSYNELMENSPIFQKLAEGA